MALVSFTNLAGGLVKDINTELMPSDPVVWTEANNIRFYNQSAYKTSGSTAVITTPIAPYFAVTVDNGQKSQIIVCGLNQIYVYYSGTFSNITNTSGNYVTPNSNWQFTSINSFPIFNNGINTPQVWTSLAEDIPLVDLPNWPANMQSQAVRAYKAYLLAANCTESGIVYPTRVRWSGSALPGSIPQTWDETDITNDAGYIDLSDTPGPIIDMRVLGDNLMIYKQRATYLCMYIGGSNIFSFKQVFNNIGLLNKDCICDIGAQHFMVTEDDVILTDGNSYKSIIDGKIRRALFNSLNTQKIEKMYVVPNYKQGEIWICIPTGTSGIANMAYIYNYNTGVWSTRSLANIPNLTLMPLDISTATSYDSTNTQFDSTNVIYNQGSYNINQYYFVGCDPTNNRLLQFDTSSSQDGGVNQIATLERQNIKINDDENIKIIKRIWPKMTKINGSSNIVNFYIGTQMKRNQSITWSNAMPFDVLNDDKIDFFASGRWISLRIESTTDINWSIENLEFEVENGGKW